MTTRDELGGVIHTYQKYDPLNFPPPDAPQGDAVAAAMEHWLEWGDMREFTAEELANAIHLDISQIEGLGPSLESIRRMLLERKRKILETYETKRAERSARIDFERAAQAIKPPSKLADRYRKAVKQEQLHDLERLFYAAGDDRSEFARALVPLIDKLGTKYQVDELAANYAFTGREELTPRQALEVKAELEEIDRLLKQLEEALKQAKPALIDMDSLSKFADEESLQQLSAIRQQMEDLLREMAERQGLDSDRNRRGFQLTPQAMRLFQSRLLTAIFSELQASRTGRHAEAVDGDGAQETPHRKPYEFGDAISHMDIPSSFVNALLRSGPGLPVRLTPADIEIHTTRNHPQAATCVLLDMSGSMRYDGQYVNVKRMGLALDGLIRREYPGDKLQFVEMYTFARLRPVGELLNLLPKPVTIHHPVVRLRADMSNPAITEDVIPPHFTNIQHALQLARQYLCGQPTPNKQVVLITDGLPTAHFEGPELYLLYPPDPRTEAATMREALLCAREGITINIFLLQSWNQSHEDIQFAYRLAESTRGRVFFTAGRDLDRFVVWDYIKRRKSILS